MNMHYIENLGPLHFIQYISIITLAVVTAQQQRTASSVAKATTLVAWQLTNTCVQSVVSW